MLSNMTRLTFDCSQHVGHLWTSVRGWYIGERRKPKLSLKACSHSMGKSVCFSRTEKADVLGSVVNTRLVKQRLR